MLKVIVILLALGLIVEMSEKSPSAAIVVILVCIAIYIAFKYQMYKEDRAKAEQNAESERAFWDQAYGLIAEHIPTLARKEKQMVIEDDYGNPQFDAWFREIDYFINNVIATAPGFSNYYENSPIAAEKHSELRNSIINGVYEYKKEAIKSNSFDGVDVDNLDPQEFEHYCSDLLGRAGWISKVTQASGDQGVDIIAKLGDIKAVFQCKKYSQPVGNAAIQEVIAGKIYEQANIAAVVTNATFTLSAQKLAASADVHLLHFSELSKFAEKLRLD